jgi:hypothetical protein
MKNIALITMLALGITLNAQVNKNVTKETTTTTTTVNDGQKPRTIVKTEKTEAQQNIELKDAESKKLNKDVKPTPVQVTSSTTVSGDGIPTQEIDRSSYYQMNGQNYRFVTDKTGYKISAPDNTDYGILRKTSNNNYIYRTKDRTSVGYFDANGNFVLETYDDKTDGITVETYTRLRQ